ncbi:unnamed protein product [Cladocopium goreaui]|uniref:Uncharacterized protein n=1 Tax=Cladocopium goreaui TaxID=2562237 RepID=A0A9P1GID6_9DINO|nr:unnamed protein product [Cladocopium goreaui]
MQDLILQMTGQLEPWRPWAEQLQAKRRMKLQMKSCAWENLLMILHPRSSGNKRYDTYCDEAKHWQSVEKHHPVERCRAIRTLCSGATPATFYGSLTTKLVAATWSYAVVMAVPKRFLSNSLSQYSTHYVEFSLKIVAKSSKLMPTMLISGLLGNSRYFQAVDYIAAILLCAGTAFFSYSPKASVSTTSSQVALGMCALGLSCVFDGLVPNVQQRLLRDTTPSELMARTNAVGAVAGGAVVGAVRMQL